MHRFFLVLLLFIGMAGCGSDAADSSKGWDNGFNNGFKIGKARGIAIGKAMAEGPVEEWDLPIGWRLLAREAIAVQLKDPNSAEYKIDSPKFFSRKQGKITQFYWEVIVSVNARNSFGGLTGFQNWLVGFNSDGVEYAKPE